MFKLIMVLSILISLTACSGDGIKKDDNSSNQEKSQSEKVIQLLIMDEVLNPQK